MTVIEYLNQLIKDYYCTSDFFIKKSIANSIYNYYNSFEKYEFNSIKDFMTLKKIYRNYLANTKIKINNNFNHDVSKYMDNANNDLKYVKELLKFIKIKKRKNNKLSNNKLGDLIELENYISCNSNFYNMYKNGNYDLIIDNTISGCSVLELDKKYVIVLNKLNIGSFIHELMHIYNYIFSKYGETPSIMAELAMTKKFNITDDCNRINDIIDLKKLEYHKIKDIYDYDTYCYGIASLIAISFINIHGTNFNDIIKINDYITKHEYIELNKFFKYLNIKENEIINSLNKAEKALAYKK